MPKAKKVKVEEGLIRSCLPDAPEGYRHSIEKVSATIFRVVLHHPDRYVYKEGVRTDWGYIKGGKVFTPRGGKPSKVEVCDLLDLRKVQSVAEHAPKITTFLL